MVGSWHCATIDFLVGPFKQAEPTFSWTFACVYMETNRTKTIMLKYNIQGDQGMVYWLTCIPEDLEKTNNNDQSITSKGVNVWYIHLHLPQQTLAFHATQTYHTWIPYGYWTLLSIMLATGMCYIKLSSSKRLAYTLAVHHCWSLHLRISKMKSSWENQHPPPFPRPEKRKKQ